MSQIFGKHNKDLKQIDLYNEFIQLSDADQVVLEKLDQLLEAKEFDQMAREISKLSNKMIFKLCENSKTIKSFCDVKTPRFNYHMKVWQNFLDTNFLHLGKNFVSLDRKHFHTVFQQFVSSYLLSEYKKLQETSSETLLQEKLLNKMCQMDYFYGLIERAKRVIAKLAGKPQEEERTNLLGQFKLDIATLCNVYADVGYIYASKLLHDLSDVLALQNFSGAKTLAKHFSEDAVLKFFAGKYLYELRPQKHANFTYANGRGNVLDMVFDQPNWEAAEKFVAASIGNKPALMKELKNSAEKEITKIVDKHPLN